MKSAPFPTCAKCGQELPTPADGQWRTRPTAAVSATLDEAQEKARRLSVMARNREHWEFMGAANDAGEFVIFTRRRTPVSQPATA